MIEDKGMRKGGGKEWHREEREGKNLENREQSMEMLE